MEKTTLSAHSILTELQFLGNESTKNVLLKHGAREPFYGVKVEDLKKIQKRVKKDYALSLALYDTGVSDAMYLAGLIADETRMTKADLQQWAEQAYWYMLSEYTVPWVAAETRFGPELGAEWINSPQENIASSGWCTHASLTALKPDAELNLEGLSVLLRRVQAEIHQAPNRVRFGMNNFVIAAGAYVPALTEQALAVGQAVGTVQVDMGGTACKVPFAPAYIEKVRQKGALGRKRKTMRC